MEALATLRVRQIVEETKDAKIRFVHDKLREIAYESIPHAERPLLHLRAAQAIESLRPGAQEVHADLALHFAKAGIHHEAARHFAVAAERARAAYANGEAIAFHRAAIREARASAGVPGVVVPSIGVLAEGLGDLLSLGGQQPQAREAYAEALVSSPGTEALRRARLFRKIGKAWEIHHEHERALLSYADAEAALGEPDAAAEPAWWQERVQISLDRLWVCYWLNRVDEMRVLVDRARPSILEHATAYQRVRFFQLLAMMNIRIERYVPSVETLGYARSAMSASEDWNDIGSAATVRFVLFFALVLHGSVDEAEEHGLAVLTAADRTGAVPLRARCLAYLMLIARRRGDVDATRVWAAKCMSASEAGKMDEYLGLVKANLA